MAIESSDGETLEPIKRLDFGKLLVKIANDDGTPRNLSSDTIVFEARLKVADVTPLFVKSSQFANQIEKLDQTQEATRGMAYIYIQPADTQSLSKTVSLECQIEVTDNLGNPDTTMFRLPVTFRQ